MADDRPAGRTDDPRATGRIDAVVRGRVQGVGFRYFAWREAMDLDLAGWVANEVDGSVHCVAEGPRHLLEEYLERLRAGPPAASIDRVDVVWMSPAGGLGPFAVRSGGHRGD